jgi:hypothetical protein
MDLERIFDFSDSRYTINDGGTRRSKTDIAIAVGRHASLEADVLKSKGKQRALGRARRHCAPLRLASAGTVGSSCPLA